MIYTKMIQRCKGYHPYESVPGSSLAMIAHCWLSKKNLPTDLNPMRFTSCVTSYVIYFRWMSSPSVFPTVICKMSLNHICQMLGQIDCNYVSYI